MSFKTVLQSDLTNIFNAAEFADNAIYYFDDSSSKSITMVSSGKSDLATYASGQARIMEAYLIKSEINRPSTGEEILDLNTNIRWKIDQVLSETQGVIKVLLSSDQRSDSNG